MSDDDLSAVDREVSQRVASAGSAFAGARELRLRLRKVQGALLCVAAVGFAGGGLVTSTAASGSPLGAIVDALEALPGRIDRMQRVEGRSAGDKSSDKKRAQHAAVREELKKLLG